VSAAAGAVALPLSAPDPAALAELGGCLAAHARAHPDLDPADLAFTLAGDQALLPHRAVVMGGGREELLEGLDALAGGSRAGALVVGSAAEGATAFMFTGQGAQRAGMGAGLDEAFPVFRAALDELCAEIDPLLGRSLKEVMWAPKGSPEAALLDRTEVTQPALFALEVSLFRLVESFGLRPDYLIGHSIGELAAAHVAGVLSLPDACRLVCARGRLMGALPEGGAMLAVEAAEDDLAAALEGLGESVSIAAVNGPRAVVLSVGAEEIDRLQETLADDGRRMKRLAVSHAFHSPLMDPMLGEFRQEAARIGYAAPRIAVVTNLSGEVADPEQLASANHWVAQVRGAVRFAAGVATLEEAGVIRFVELGPDGILAMAASQSVGDELAEKALFVAAMRRRGAEPAALLAALAAAHVAGGAVDWAQLVPGGRQVELPPYPFRREPY
jgi:acyl transferase domain-containing protein